LATTERKKLAANRELTANLAPNANWHMADGKLVSGLDPRLRIVQRNSAPEDKESSREAKEGELAPRVQQQPRSSLTIGEARAKLDEATYECQLIRVAGGQPVEEEEEPHVSSEKARPEVAHAEGAPLKKHRFELRLLVAPRLAPFEFPRDAQLGQRVLLTCAALEGQQPISFVWLKDNQILEAPSAAGSGAGSAQTSSLTVGEQASAGATAGGVQAGGSAALEASGKVAAGGNRVKQQRQPPGPSLAELHRRQLADKFALSAGSERASPTANKWPPSSELVLVERRPFAADELEEPLQVGGEQQAARRLAGNALLADRAIRVRQSDDYSILAIDPLELRHAGRYTCSAQNEAARVSHSAQLTINGECFLYFLSLFRSLSGFLPVWGAGKVISAFVSRFLRGAKWAPRQNGPAERSNGWTEW